MYNVKNVEKSRRTPENHPFRFKKKPKPEFPAKALESVGKAVEASRARACATPSAGTAEIIGDPETSFSEMLQRAMPLEAAIQVLKEQMEATTSFYNLKERKLMTRPDHRTRLAAAELYLAYLIGKPIERRVIEQHNIDSHDDVVSKLAKSTAGREEIKKLLAEAEAIAAQGTLDQPTGGQP